MANSLVVGRRSSISKFSTKSLEKQLSSKFEREFERKAQANDNEEYCGRCGFISKRNPGDCDACFSRQQGVSRHEEFISAVYHGEESAVREFAKLRIIEQFDKFSHAFANNDIPALKKSLNTMLTIARGIAKVPEYAARPWQGNSDELLFGSANTNIFTIAQSYSILNEIVENMKVNSNDRNWKYLVMALFEMKDTISSQYGN